MDGEIPNDPSNSSPTSGQLGQSDQPNGPDPNQNGVPDNPPNDLPPLPDLGELLDRNLPGWNDRPARPPNPQSPPADYSTEDQTQIERRCISYLATLPPSIQGSNGSAALMRAARAVCWGFDLGAERGQAILAEHFNPLCDPPWSDSELAHKCRDAIDPATVREARGWLLHTEPPERSRPSARSSTAILATSATSATSAPSSNGTPWPTAPGDTAADEENESCAGFDDDDPFMLARRYLSRFQRPDGSMLRFYNADHCLWEDGAYTILRDEEIRGSVARFVDVEFTRRHRAAMIPYQNNRERGAGERMPRKKKVTRAVVSDTLQAIQAITRVVGDISPPCWFCDGPPTTELIATRNGILHLPRFVNGDQDAFNEATPLFFTFNRIRFDFEVDAPEPRHWLHFLNQLWPDDPESIACLQEWFGYLLTPDTSLQKILLILGPTRSGKGTIGKIIRELVGMANCVAPTLGRLASEFGLQSLLNKTVACISDVRLSGRADQAAIVEELLSISGEDLRTIPRKHQASVTCRLPTRFVFLSNEFPALGDASGALLGRFIILRMTESWLGREDKDLDNRLRNELPGILLWAIEGWRRIQETHEFTDPTSAQSLRDEARAVVSPIALFVAQTCEVGTDLFAETGELYQAWVRWCREHGREHVENRERFIVRLRSVLPSISPTRPREGFRRIYGYSGIRLLSEFEQGNVIPD